MDWRRDKTLPCTNSPSKSTVPLPSFQQRHAPLSSLDPNTTSRNPAPYARNLLELTVFSLSRTPTTALAQQPANRYFHSSITATNDMLVPLSISGYLTSASRWVPLLSASAIRPPEPLPHRQDHVTEKIQLQSWAPSLNPRSSHSDTRLRIEPRNALQALFSSTVPPLGVD